MDSTPCRILLVDDLPPIRAALRALLTSYDDVDLQVVGEAANGKQAIEQMTSCRPDVILMDINMPEMNGIQATSAIKKSWKDSVIIGLCVIQDAYITGAFLKAGGSAVISKDRFGDLRSTIRKACMNKHSG